MIITGIKNSLKVIFDNRFNFKQLNVINMLNEKDLYPIIAKELKKMKYCFPITDEFGLRFADYKRRVDVFGCKWDSTGNDIETIGIEVKYSPNKSINLEFSEGLSQCIDYLPFFKYVGLCYRTGKIEQHLENICNVLTINRITIDLKNSVIKFPNELIECKFNNKDILKHVLLRSSMILSFYETFSKVGFKDKDIKYGEFRNGEGWLAINFKNHLQINTGYNYENNYVSLGVNLERKSTFKNIIKNITRNDILNLKKLFQDHSNMKINFSIDRRTSATKENKKELETIFKNYPDMQIHYSKTQREAKIWKGLKLLDIGDKKINALIEIIRKTLEKKQWRPHLAVHVKLWNTINNKQWHINKINEEKNKLMKFVNFFEKLV